MQPYAHLFSYVQRLKALANRIISINSNRDDPEIESYSLYFTNCITLLSVVGSLTYALLYIIINQKGWLIYFVFAGIFSLSFVFNYFGLRKIASLYILSLNASIVILMSLYGGFDSQVHMLLILVTISSVSIFSLKLAIVYNLILFTMYVIAHNYSERVGPWLETPVMPNREYINFGIVIFSAFVIARLIFNNVLRYINQLKQNLNEANEFINVITTQKEKLEMFNTIAAHDLRTPIRQIIGFSGLAQRWENSKDQKTQLDEYLEHISKAGYRMSELIDSISLLKKVSNATDVPYTSIDIYSVISDIESTNLKHSFDQFKIENNCSHKIKFNFSHLHLVVTPFHRTVLF